MAGPRRVVVPRQGPWRHAPAQVPEAPRRGAGVWFAEGLCLPTGTSFRPSAAGRGLQAPRLSTLKRGRWFAGVDPCSWLVCVNSFRWGGQCCSSRDGCSKSLQPGNSNPDETFTPALEYHSIHTEHSSLFLCVT